MAAPAIRSRQSIEAMLEELLPRLTPVRTGRGRPEILPAALLWAGLLVCILRGTSSQLGIARLLSHTGLWRYPRVPVTAEAVRIRLQRSGPATMQQLFTAVTQELIAQDAGDLTLAPFATGVYALDDSTLDQVARTLPALHDLPPGDDRLLPGKLCTAFDVRRQIFHTMVPTDLPRQNSKVAFPDLVATLPVGSLLLVDLGYFSFPGFDALTDDGYFFISKLRNKTSWEPVHVFTKSHGVYDALIWLGRYRADRAKHLVRLITVRVGGQTYRLITNVCDPQVLPAAEAIRLYLRRWDIELAFKLIKRELGLHLLWSARWEMILTQVWGVLIIAQIASSVRQQIARRAGVELFDVSLVLILRDLPALVERGEPDLIGVIAALPRGKGGYIRASRRTVAPVPPDLPIDPAPPGLPTTRPPRYAGRKCGPNHSNTPR